MVMVGFVQWDIMQQWKRMRRAHDREGLQDIQDSYKKYKKKVDQGIWLVPFVYDKGKEKWAYIFAFSFVNA